MAWPRLVWGETVRERELRALADSQARHAERLRRQRDDLSRQLEAIAANDAAREHTVHSLQWSLKAAEAERDEARRLLADAKDEHDEARRMLEVMEADRDGWRQLREVAQAERDEAQRDAREERLTLGIVARNLRRIADDIEPRDDSQDDRPATDSGAEGAGTTPE